MPDTPPDTMPDTPPEPMREPMPDLIVMIPGIGGSVLARHGREVWAPKAGAALRAVLSLGGGLDTLALRHGDDPALDDLDDGVQATALLPDLHVLPGLDWKIDGYGLLRRRLFRRFDLAEGRNYLEFPYDWRRDCRVAARRLAREAGAAHARWRQASANPDAKLVLVAHSMGGIVSRLFLEFEGGAALTRRLVTFGTPYSGSVKALNVLANGLRPGWGPFALDVSALLRSFTSVYQLLPSYRCLRAGAQWLALDAAPAGALPPLVDAARVRDALALHRALRAAVDAADQAAGGPLRRYDIRPVVGDTQRTPTAARADGVQLEVLHAREAAEHGGDGTVPRLSAVPHELLGGWTNAAFFSEQHASLQNDEAVFEHLSGLLRIDPQPTVPVFPALAAALAVQVEDIVRGDDLLLQARPAAPLAALQAQVQDLARGTSRSEPLVPTGDGGFALRLPGLDDGDYRITVHGAGARPVTALASVVDVATLDQPPAQP
jgi:hypothetical protein